MPRLSCKSGFSPRKGYIRKSYYRKSYYRKDGTFVKGSRVKSTHVEPECIKERGKHATPSSPKNRLGIKLRKGELTKEGYSGISYLDTEHRHKALDKAVKNYGGLTVFRKLNILQTFHKYKTTPADKKLYNILGKDKRYVEDKYYDTKYWM